jgi:transcriptional regulatory protein RtcR
MKSLKKYGFSWDPKRRLFHSGDRSESAVDQSVRRSDGVRLWTPIHNLSRAVAIGRFRDDLDARLNLWTFTLPGLAERKEDIAPNLDYELDRFAEREGERITFNKEARALYLAFATAPDATWPGNFRDLAASVNRMATFSPKGRIDSECVRSKIVGLKRLWSGMGQIDDPLACLLAPDQDEALDPFDRVQLVHVVGVCRSSRSLSEAGRTLFAASRSRRATSNDADRLRKYLARFDLTWQGLNG